MVSDQDPVDKDALVQVRVAGRLANSITFWNSLTQDSYILKAVRGYSIEFVKGKIPVQWFIPRPIKFSSPEELVIDQTVDSLKDKGVIIDSKHEPGEFVNNIFVRPKKDGTKFRMILNLKPLNKYVAYHKFKMDTLR